MPEESPHPLEVWPIQEVLARMTLGVSFTFFAVRINATTEVTEDSIPCTTPPNLRCQSQLGDRKSVVLGKRLSVRVDLGGRRDIKTTPTDNNQIKSKDKQIKRKPK